MRPSHFLTPSINLNYSVRIYFISRVITRAVTAIDFSRQGVKKESLFKRNANNNKAICYAGQGYESLQGEADTAKPVG